MKGVFEVLLVIMLAWNVITQPVCKPNTTCQSNKSTDGDKYYFDINGRNQLKVNQVIFIEENKQQTNYIGVCCNCYDDKKTDNYRLSADEPALPVMSSRISVTSVEFKGCTVPINGSYHEALDALNITFIPGKNSFLKLTELPTEPQLEEHHLAGLPIKKLLITAEHSYRPTRPKFNFLNKLHYLEELELRQNIVLEKEAIELLPVTLVKLTLKNTRLPKAESELRNGSFWLERLHSLRYLHLWEDPRHEGWANRTLILPPLGSLPNLTTAFLNSVPLAAISKSHWLKDSKLQVLGLCTCTLKEIPSDFFEGADIKKLSLCNNSLTSLPEGVFSPLKGLTELDLSDNNLDSKTLQRAMKPLVEQLEVLKVNRNPLGSLCGDGNIHGIQSSKLPTSLRRLELKKTQAKRICDDWIQNDALGHIYLDFNNITSLSYSELMMKRREVKTSVTLSLKNNSKLKEIEITKEDFHQCLNASSYIDKGSHKRVRVELQLTQLTCECDNAFWLLETLRSCSLLGLNKVSCAPKPPTEKPQILQNYDPHDITCGLYNGSCPSGCDCWKRTYGNATVVRCKGALPRVPEWPPSAAGWPIALHVAPGTLTAVPNVTLVELHAPHNNITRIGDKDFTETLRVLDVRNNSIEHISIAAAENLFHQRNKPDYRVLIAGNPLACACEDAGAILQLRRANITDWDITKCIDGNYVMEKTKIEMCENKLLLPLLLVLGTLFTLTLVVVFIRYKLPKIRQFMFDHDMCLDWVLGVRDDTDDLMKTHDVFISYSYKDYVFAKKLIEKLEDRGHSTIEHCRDWDPGKTIIQHITHSVMSARRTLLLVSDNYAKSKWGLEEFNAAHAHAMDNGSARVIVVRCELKKPEDLPPELQRYLNNNTYLDWSDQYFWNKLWRVMPIPREVQTPGIALLHGQEQPPSVRIQVALEANSVPALQLSGDKNLPLSELVLVPPTSVSTPNAQRGQNRPSVQGSPVILSVRTLSPSNNNTPTTRRIQREPSDHNKPLALKISRYLPDNNMNLSSRIQRDIPDKKTPLSRRIQKHQADENVASLQRIQREPPDKNTPLSQRIQRDPLPAPVVPTAVSPSAC